MKYFGKIKKKNWEDSDFIVITKKGKEKHFYYCVEVGSDDMWIKDSCGRGLPLDKEHLVDLIDVLIDMEIVCN